MRKLWLLAGLLALGWLLLTREPSVRMHGARSPASRSEPVAALAAQADAREHLTVQNTGDQAPELVLPRSLSGSEPPPLTLSAAGQVAIDLALRHFFDYFLSARGELPDRELEALVRTALAQRAREPSLGRALDVFDDYLRLCTAQRLEGTRASSASAADLARQIATRRALRRRYLEPRVVHAIYADEEAREDYARARARAGAETADRKMVEERSAALLGPVAQAERAQTFVLERLGWEEEEGAEPGTWADLSAFDEGAPERLAELRVRQAAFAGRKAAFMEARRAHPGASEEELHALARGLGLDDREFARVTAFLPP